MSLDLNDFVRVKTNYTAGGVNYLNVFFYRVEAISNNGSEGLTGMLQAWLDEWRNDLKPLLSDASNLVSVEADNLTQPLFYASVTVNESGDRQGERLPLSNAVNVKLVRATKATRNGSKRFGAITEADNLNGVLQWTPLEIGKVENFVSGTILLNDPFVPGDTYTLRNMIIGRTKNAQGVYELDLGRVSAVQSAQVNTLISTQVSRKR